MNNEKLKQLETASDAARSAYDRPRYLASRIEATTILIAIFEDAQRDDRKFAFVEINIHTPIGYRAQITEREKRFENDPETRMMPLLLPALKAYHAKLTEEFAALP